MNTERKQLPIWKLGLIPVFMFGFGFALIPLYDVFCDITGLNGKIDLIPGTLLSSDSDTAKTGATTESNATTKLQIQFTATSDQEQLWQFKPLEPIKNIRAGQQYKTAFTISNPTDRTIQFHSVPSVSPGLANDYLIKTECFCFQQQELAPGQTLEMPLVFQIRTDIPEEYRKLTLAYRLYSSY